MKKRLLPLLFTLLAALVVTVALQRFYLYRPLLTATIEAEIERPVTFSLSFNDQPADKTQYLRLKPGQDSVSAELETNTLHSLKLAYDPASSGAVKLRRFTLGNGNEEYVFADESNTPPSFCTPQELRRQEDAPQLTFRTANELRTGRSCDIALLLSVFFICVLLFWKVFTGFPRPRLPHFSRPVGKAAWISAAFVSVFCVLLALPASKLNTENASKAEKRDLAQAPRVFPKGRGFNLHFGRDFDSWLQDRFLLRTQLVRAYIRTVAKLNGNIMENGTAVMNQENGWMFFKSFLNQQTPPEAQMDEWADNLRYLQQFCETHGITPYLLICPGKESVYAEHAPAMLTAPQESVFHFLEHLNKRGVNICTVYPYEELRRSAAEQPDCLLHFKTDTHINEDGTYEMMKVMAAKLQERYPELVLQPKSAFKTTLYPQRFGAEYKGKKGLKELGPITGDLEQMLMLDDAPPALHDYPHYSWEQGGLSIKRLSIPMAVVTHFDGGHRKAVLIGDSTTQYIRPWLQTMFEDMLRLRANNNGPDGNELRMSRWESQIIRFKPDVLIICLGEGSLFTHVSTMY